MLKSVRGLYNGKEVLNFIQESGDSWSVTVPAVQSGEYIVQLWAIDYAGNESYWGSVLYEFNLETMSVKLKELNITSAARKAGFSHSRVWLSSVGARIKMVKEVV